MDPRSTLEGWAASASPAPLSLAGLRLARAVPQVAATLDRLLTDPLERALAGLGPTPDWPGEPDPARASVGALLAAERGEPCDLRALAALEERTRGSGDQVLVAQARVIVDPARESEARRALARQDLPYVMPGELHPLQVEILAAGDRVLPALHVDHVRKLTALVTEALVLDLRAMGLWFWPVLRALAPDRLRAPLAKVHAARRLPAGARGLAAAYIQRTGGDPGLALAGAGPQDQLLAALAALGDSSAAP